MTNTEFEDFVRRESPRVFRTLARLLGTRRNLEDLAQEVFLRLCRAMRHFRGEARLTTFLYRIIINVANDERKRLQRERQSMCSIDDPDADWHERIPAPSADPLDPLVQTEFLRFVDEGLAAAVTDTERACLVLFYQEGRSYDEICAVLNLSLGSVKTHLHRGRLRLRAHVQDHLANRRKPETPA